MVSHTQTSAPGRSLKSVVLAGGIVLTVFVCLGSVALLRPGLVSFQRSGTTTDPVEVVVAAEDDTGTTVDDASDDHNRMLMPTPSLTAMATSPAMAVAASSPAAASLDTGADTIPIPVGTEWANPCQVIRAPGDGLFDPSVHGLLAQLARLTNRDKLSGYSIFLMGNIRASGPPEKMIIYQLEQHVDTPVRTAAMRTARKCAIWDFSQMHLQQWKTRFGADGSLVPMYNQMVWSDFGRPDSPATTTLSKLRPKYPEERKDDFLHACFYGYMNDRRKKMIDLFYASEMRVIMNQLTPDTQVDCINRARVIVNVHYYPTAGLETHRIDGAHAKGKCVVSEHSLDPGLDELYAREAGVHFVPRDDFTGLLALVRDLANDIDRVEACAEKGYAHILNARVSYPQRLHDAVEKLNC